MNYTDTQLQAAIDAAFPQAGAPALFTSPSHAYWLNEDASRLAIARAFLAELGKLHPDAQEKPAWTLPPPPAGHKWHRDDWTEDMLPEGYRPLLNGELIEKSDEVWQFAEGPWKNESIAVGLTVSSRNHHFRTRRPLPSWSQASAELIQKAEATGVDLDAQPRQPAPGDVVRLKSGGPEMTVTQTKDNECRTQWFTNGRIEFSNFFNFCLEPVNKKHD